MAWISLYFIVPCLCPSFEAPSASPLLSQIKKTQAFLNHDSLEPDYRVVSLCCGQEILDYLEIKPRSLPREGKGNV